MKKTLGLLLFILSFSASAGSTNAVLMLRAIVPVTYEVQVKMTTSGPKASIKSNSKTFRTLPKFHIKKNKTSYLVSVVHP